MEHIAKLIRDVPNFPKEGILFKDITPIFSDPEAIYSTRIELTNQILNAGLKSVDCIIGIESRGFLFGVGIAEGLDTKFALARKPGKLPHTKISKTYNLEYGTNTIEMHTDAINPGDNVIIHDDLLATGGTAIAVAELIKELGGNVVGFSFIIELESLEGKKKIQEAIGEDVTVLSLLKY